MFRSIEFRAYCHATEDEDRVAKAIATLCPEGAAQKDTFEGHHKNPIVLITCRIERAEEISAFWRRCRDADLVRTILEDLPKRIDDEGVLYLRFDKQEACQGRIELARHEDVVAVRAKVSAFPAKKSELIRAARDYLAKV